MTKKRIQAFTLIELLAVIGIISVLAVIIGASLGGGNASVSLGNGQRIASGIFQAARSVAIVKGSRARVIIYKEGKRSFNNDTTKQLRFMGIVYESTTTPGEWIPANSGTYLPEGIYFLPPDYSTNSDYLNGLISGKSLSGSSNAGNTDDLSISSFNYTNTGDSNDNANDFDVSYPVFSRSGSDEDTWYFYEYNSRGISENPGAYFVLAAASKDAPTKDDQLYSLNFDNQYAVSGFAIRKLGGVSMYTDKEDINQ